MAAYTRKSRKQFLFETIQKDTMMEKPLLRHVSPPFALHRQQVAVSNRAEMIASPRFFLIDGEGNPMVEGGGDENRGRRTKFPFYLLFSSIFRGSVILWLHPDILWESNRRRAHLRHFPLCPTFA